VGGRSRSLGGGHHGYSYGTVGTSAGFDGEVAFYVGHRCVAFPRAEDLGGGAQVQMQCRLDRGRGRYSLDPGAHGLRFAGVACSFLGCP
jgi:hypothetical protein